MLKEFSVQARKPDQGAPLSAALQIAAISSADCLSTAAAAPNESAASASHQEACCSNPHHGKWCQSRATRDSTNELRRICDLASVPTKLNEWIVFHIAALGCDFAIIVSRAGCSITPYASDCAFGSAMLLDIALHYNFNGLTNCICCGACHCALLDIHRSLIGNCDATADMARLRGNHDVSQELWCRSAHGKDEEA